MTVASQFSALAGSVRTGWYIGGCFSDPKQSATFSVIDPATEGHLAEVADAGPAEASLALDAAEAALSSWAGAAPRARAEALRRAFELMIERRELLANGIALENGKTLSDARAEIIYAAEFFRWFSEEAVRNIGSIYTAPNGDKRIVLIDQPIGVSVLITPWNFPAAMLTRKLAPALAAGCSVICKPAEDTPLTALSVVAILEEAGVPAGVVNLLPTSRPGELVDVLLSDSRVRKLSFTGSTEVGRSLLEKAARGIVNCSMELGGNAPFIVFGDCDIDSAVADAVTAKMRNSGQVCTAANRFYVETSIAEEFTERFAKALGSLRIGAGIDPESEVGPLINADALDKVEDLVAGAVNDGARAIVGGRRVKGSGFFFEPTVLADVAPHSLIMQSEIFGPVAPVVTFEDEKEVIALANDTSRGLLSYVYSSDLARAMRVAESLEAGMVAINRAILSDPAAPFGGVKESGLGREGGPGGMAEFLETKYIATRW